MPLLQVATALDNLVPAADDRSPRRAGEAGQLVADIDQVGDGAEQVDCDPGRLDEHDLLGAAQGSMIGCHHRDFLTFSDVSGSS